MRESLQTKVRAIHNEAQPEKVGKVPSAPKYLCEYGREMFERLAPKLVRLHLLTEIDDVLLIMYCDAWATWRHARETYNTLTYKSSGAERREIARTINKARIEVMKLGVDLGLSPGARTRIDIGKARVDDEATEADFF